MTELSTKRLLSRISAACSGARSRAQALLGRTHYQILEERRLRHILAAYRGKQVLDIGCGLGKYLKMLSELGCRATGVDINPDQVAALHEQGLRAFTPDALPEGESYDLVLMAHVIEHMDTTELLACMNRYLPLLADGGKLIIVTPMPGERFWYDFTHVRPYLPQSVRMMFGGITAPSSTRTRQSMTMEEVYFFNDSWRLRNFSAFYPFSASALCKRALFVCNVFLAALHALSAGRLGARASWLGIYASSRPS